MALSQRQKLTIIPLLFYWPTIFILAHIRIPELVYKARVSDKILHFLAYLILTFLLWFAISPDKKVNWRKAAVWWVLLVVVWYGALDEFLQGYVAGRSRNAADFFTNLGGTLTGLILFSFLTFWPGLLVVTATTIFLLTNLARANLADLLPVTNTLFHLFGYGAFAMLWIRNMNRFLPLKAAKLKWLIVATATPMGYLLFVKVFSVISGRYFGVRDVVVSAAAIVAVIATVFLIEDRRQRTDDRRQISDF